MVDAVFQYGVGEVRIGESSCRLQSSDQQADDAPVAALSRGRVGWSPTSASPYADDVGSTQERGQPMSDLQLAGQAMSTGDVDGAIVHLSAAVRGLTDAGDNRQAALASARLGDLFANMLGNKVAARPWYTRAIRLVEHEGPCVEQGWVAVAPMGCDVDDSALLVERADLALARARSFGSIDLELKALADGGLARVQLGRVVDGMEMVDQAMALACSGGAEDAEVVAKSICSFFTACYYTADFERVATWSRLLRDRGIVGTAPGPPAFLSSHCDSVQGMLLCHLGRWTEAERVLVGAYDAVERAMPGSAWHPPIALAELRILQGRLAEAEALLLGRDDQIQALLPTARLHLARGDHDLARATARRGLRVLGDDRVRAAALLGVVIEAELAKGDVAAAAAVSLELDGVTAGVSLPALRAESARVRALVRTAQGDAGAAVAALHEGLGRLSGVDLPLVTASLHLALARLQEEQGDRAGATVEARAAGALLARLDVVVGVGAAALLTRLGVEASRTGPGVGCRVATLQREGAWWTAGCGDTHVRLGSTKGLSYLAELLGHPGTERHALDLVDLVEGVTPVDTGIDRRLLGDAGDLLDAQSRSAYRRRVAELRDEVEDALAVEDDDGAAAIQRELDALVAELARAFGLGGRSRKASSTAEKARLNVTRALRAAVGRVTQALPDAGAVLDRRVRTGLFCAYEPHPDDSVIWTAQS